MPKKILVANRGEIACRIMRTVKRMGIGTVAVYSHADADSVHVENADEAVCIGAPEPRASYLSIDAIIRAAKSAGADAVHPGYGFLSENAEFAERLECEGILFIGPPADAIRKMGDKITSKQIAAVAGVPIVPGHDSIVESVDEAARIAKRLGFPLMLKASAGGGGKGMRTVSNEKELREDFAVAQSEAANAFGDSRMLIERFVVSPRHIEIQILADKHGNCIHLNERDCSIQRRNQKIVEESPSNFLDEATRAEMGSRAVALAKAVNYHSAGTVEFIVDSSGSFYFLEMNTRLQVEHPVTELVTGIDLVEQMIRIADGEALRIAQDKIKINGWAFETRIYAENPRRSFLPSTGRLTRYRSPPSSEQGDATIRNDSGVIEGSRISVHYDPMISKLCSWGPTRESARKAMAQALDVFEIEGVESNLSFLSAVIDHPEFVKGDFTTGFIEQTYPEGFKGIELPEDLLQKVASAAVFMQQVSELRRLSISDRLFDQEHAVATSWRVKVNDWAISVDVDGSADDITMSLAGGQRTAVESDWRPGCRLAQFRVGKDVMTFKTEPIIGGFRIRWRGADMNVQVQSPRQAELSHFMRATDGSEQMRHLTCPMPGLVVAIDVEEGEHVQEGQPLCTIEAMKMENVLRAERSATISRICVQPGDSLALDAVIIEFE